MTYLPADIMSTPLNCKSHVKSTGSRGSRLFGVALTRQNYLLQHRPYGVAKCSAGRGIVFPLFCISHVKSTDCLVRRISGWHLTRQKYLLQQTPYEVAICSAGRGFLYHFILYITRYINGHTGSSYLRGALNTTASTIPTSSIAYST